MRGKKFDAAEKHFEKKRLRYEKQIKELCKQAEYNHGEIQHLRSKCELAERENEELKNWVERLLEYTELTKDDIRKACEKDKRMAEAAEWLSKWGDLSIFK